MSFSLFTYRQIDIKEHVVTNLRCSGFRTATISELPSGFQPWVLPLRVYLRLFWDVDNTESELLETFEEALYLGLSGVVARC